MIKLDNIKMPLDYDMEMLLSAASAQLNADKEKILSFKLLRRSTEMRQGEVYFKISVGITLAADEKKIAYYRRSRGASYIDDAEYITPRIKCGKRPIVVGFGPAGIFAALILAEAGAMPIVLERGFDVDTRSRDIERFRQGGALSEESNVHFGEGGAGAYSDGKLKMGEVDIRKKKILSEFVSAGASDDIMWLDKKHIGSDSLHNVIKNLRRKIVSLGGEVRFGARFEKIIEKNGACRGVGFTQGGEYRELECDSLILAIGHSARDTIEYLHNSEMEMESKGFGVGLRIEHPQGLVDRLRYGKYAGDPKLGAADYKFVTHLENGRGVYSFCMCPGGYVVAASSEKNSICTNGMSEAARDGVNANSALLVSVRPEDFGSDNALAGIDFQRKIERAAFDIGNNYYAPVQRLEDFLGNRPTTAFGGVLPTYLPGTVFAEHDSYMPQFVCQSLRAAFADMEKRLSGFLLADALLTGPETGTTSPVLIKRDGALESVSVSGVYPCGEGAGYAGGIISSAVDGIRCAEMIINKR